MRNYDCNNQSMTKFFQDVIKYTRGTFQLTSQRGDQLLRPNRRKSKNTYIFALEVTQFEVWIR